MTRNVIFIGVETQLNKILRDQRKSKENTRILFVSLWDEWANILVDSLENYEDDVPLYVVNSFMMPHAFTIFKVTKAPCLLTLLKDRYQKEDHLPRIYKELGCDPVIFSI